MWAKGGRGNEKKEKMGMKRSTGRLTALLRPSYKYAVHKKLKILSDDKLSDVCQTGGYKKLRYFER